jgi:hypothetical protein
VGISIPENFPIFFLFFPHRTTQDQPHWSTSSSKLYPKVSATLLSCPFEFSLASSHSPAKRLALLVLLALFLSVSALSAPGGHT